MHFRPGSYLFHEGDPADTLLRAPARPGRDRDAHARPRTVVLDTADDGDVVGWSWLIPPYRWTFDAAATEETSAIAFDGGCLRGKCEEDPAWATRCCSGSCR